MKTTISKTTIALILALAMLAAVLFNNATRSLKPSLIEHSAVLSEERAAMYVLPSQFTAMIGVCLEGQRLSVWKPGIFGYYRARCNETVGWIQREHIRVED